MGSKKSSSNTVSPDAPEDGRSPKDTAQCLATRYQFRRDGDAIGVPYAVWADLSDHYWHTCGRMGPAMGMPPTDKPDALPLYVEAELDACQGDPGKGAIKSRCLWIYPKG